MSYNAGGEPAPASPALSVPRLRPPADTEPALSVWESEGGQLAGHAEAR